ncbi:MAG: hypothetical protein V4772_26400 [Pseudomonadota bacterium]
MLSIWMAAFVFGLFTTGTSPVLAQAPYSCKGSGGRYVPSYSPCESGTASGMVYYPPAESRSSSSSYNQSQRYERPLPRAQDAEPFVQYMGPMCAGLSDNIRTAASRGVSYERIGDMRREYNNKCEEEEQDARDRVYKAKGEKRLEKLEAMKSDKLDQERANIKAQQCGESKRILTNKKARTDLTDGEKMDLQRFEDNYRARCG